MKKVFAFVFRLSSCRQLWCASLLDLDGDGPYEAQRAGHYIMTNQSFG